MPGTAAVVIDSTCWDVSVASTSAERSQGLGGLLFLPAGQGMLFDLGYSQQVTVTTYPMLFDLDIIFLDDQCLVSSVCRNITPGHEITEVCRYFLEVNAGEAAGVELGDQARISISPTQEQVDILMPVIFTFMMMAVISFGLSALGRL